LLDRVLTFEESTLVAEVTIHADSMFFDGEGVPGWVGLEYMAQAVAAHAGLQARQRGEPPAIGYLLGTRSYQCDAETFPVGETLTVHVEALFVEMALGAFACRIETDRPLASATINVYQPEEDSTEGVDSGRIS
jgi:predicted hotdog family 3-hydroxylacyl-ACP dehydratase